MARVGRPTKLTAALQRKIVDAIRAGNYRKVAAAWAGIPEDTLNKWMARKGPPYEAFRQAVLEAEQAAEIEMVALVRKAAKDDAKHAEWWLERKFPDRWGRKDRAQVEVSGRGGGPIEVRSLAEIMAAFDDKK